jgi:hypothetical protein
MTWLIMTLNLVLFKNAVCIFLFRKFCYCHYLTGFFKFCICLAFLNEINGLNLGNPERRENVQVFVVSVML